VVGIVYLKTVSPTCLKGTHARDFMVRFSDFFGMINNRQGRGPEFYKSC
jgi:hypothetical protein